MHGFWFIERMGQVDTPLSDGYGGLFVNVDWHIGNHDAMGLVLMGGEL